MSISANKEEYHFLYKKPDYRYRDFELDAFQKLLEPFRTTKHDNMGEFSFIDFRAFLRANGGLTRDGAIIVTGFKRIVPKGSRSEDYVLDCNTTTYEIYMDKYDQLINLLNRRKYGERMKLEQLDNLAKNMLVNDTDLT